MNTRTLEVVDYGSVKRMSLPSGWLETEIVKKHEFDLTSLREFHHPEQPDVRLTFYFRPLRIALESGQAFTQTLGLPPHQLAPAELEAITDVLQEAADPERFELANACTEDWNGKRVLIVEGRWRAVRADHFQLCVDMDGSGCAVQEIYFWAPADRFRQFLPEAKSALRSIEWRSLQSRGPAQP